MKPSRIEAMKAKAAADQADAILALEAKMDKVLSELVAIKKVLSGRGKPADTPPADTGKSE